MRYQNIPQFTRGASYVVDVSWRYLSTHFYSHVKDYGLDVNPNFQRGHVWTAEQRVRYIEYILQGGKSGKDLYFNCPLWQSSLSIGPEYKDGWYVLVDGKQRIDAVFGYLSNEFPIFGKWYHRDFKDSLDIMVATFRWHVNELPTIEEVYDWYIGLNTGGTVHSDEEIARVQSLIDNKVPYTRPPEAEVLAQARLDRSVLVETKVKHDVDKADLARRAVEAKDQPSRPRKSRKR